MLIAGREGFIWGESGSGWVLWKCGGGKGRAWDGRVEVRGVGCCWCGERCELVAGLLQRALFGDWEEEDCSGYRRESKSFTLEFGVWDEENMPLCDWGTVGLPSIGALC